MSCWLCMRRGAPCGHDSHSGASECLSGYDVRMEHDSARPKKQRRTPAQPCAVPTLWSLSCSYVISQILALCRFFLIPKVLSLTGPLLTRP